MSLENPRDGGEKPVGGHLAELAVIELILHLDHVIFHRSIVEPCNKLLSGQIARGARCGINLRITVETDECKRRVAEVASQDGRV